MKARRWTDAKLLEELRRFAATVDGPIASLAFGRSSAASLATVRRHFGSWRNALNAAGLADRYIGREPREEWRRQPGKRLTNRDVLLELRRVAEVTGRPTVTGRDLEAHAPVVRRHLVSMRFGSMNRGLEAAGLQPSRHRGTRLDDADLLDNLRAVYDYLGHAPTTADLDRSPSRVSSKTYRNRFGSHADALRVLEGRLD